MTTALLLLRTPFQAWIAQQVLQQERVQAFDLLYFTQNDAPEDRYYFEKLASSATKAKYFYAPIRDFDIFGHLDFRRQSSDWLRDCNRDIVLLSSIDAFIPSAITRRQSGELITFDDGTGNFNNASLYHVEALSCRSRVYRWLLGAENLERTKRRIARHYTLHAQFPNIVEAGRLRSLESWSAPKSCIRKQALKTYFIGAPFEEELNRDQINSLESYLKELPIESYVRHPRERFPLDIGVPFLDKRGRIAEDAILADASGHQIHLVGGFSSVMFNLANVAASKRILFSGASTNTLHLETLARQVGCDIVLL
jgi:N-acetyllactosaminide alpha-2,3-sialyltransferase